MLRRPGFWWEDFNHKIATITTFLQFKNQNYIYLFWLIYFLLAVLWLPFGLIWRLFSKPTVLLNELKTEIIKFEDLPDKVREICEDLYENYPNQMRFGQSGFVNLSHVKASHHLTKGGPWAGDDYFIFENRKFKLRWEGNRQSPPFIFFENKLYYRSTMNVTYQNLWQAEFGVFDLSKYIRVLPPLS